MTRMTLGTEFFDQMYATSADPWGFGTRWYEARKYAISVALLPAEHYGDAFHVLIDPSRKEPLRARILRESH